MALEFSQLNPIEPEEGRDRENGKHHISRWKPLETVEEGLGAALIFFFLLLHSLHSSSLILLGFIFFYI